MMVNDFTAFVSLRPPLPCLSKRYGPGFAFEVSPKKIKVNFAEPFVGKIQDDDLQLSLVNGKSIDLAVTLSQLDQSNYEGELKGAKDQAAMQELLGIVRKNQHITICQDQDVESSDRYTGFSEVQFLPCALPDLNWDELDTRRAFLGRTFDAPLLISGMTGGIEQGAEINRRLALTAEAFNIPMGVGSQRLALENPEHEKIFSLKKHAPKLFLIGNVGIAQLRQPNFAELCQRAIDMIEADALAVHLNIVQEVIQVEGDRSFKGLLGRIADMTQKVSVPVIVKEVGSGIDLGTAVKLVDAGVSALDVAGRGGTAWGYIEGLRSDSYLTKEVAQSFRNWGIPTAHCLSAIRAKFPELPVVASGGIRDGLVVAKALALGATMVGMGLPLLRAALTSEETPKLIVQTVLQGLKTAMICTNAASVGNLTDKIAREAKS